MNSLQNSNHERVGVFKFPLTCKLALALCGRMESIFKTLQCGVYLCEDERGYNGKVPPFR